MSVSQNFPDEGASLVLNFAGAEKLDPRITFTRSSTGTYLDRNGLIVTAPANSPRFDHSYNGTNVESLGLLIEESRSNLLTYSEQFNDASWGKARSSVSANNITSPDGTLTADTLTEDTTASDIHGVFKSFSATSGTTYTISVFFKSKERTNIVLAFDSGAGFNHLAAFSSSTGTVGTTFGSPSATSITAYPNGWYRCSMSATATSTALANAVILLSVDNTVGGRFYTGNGTSGIYIWGAQLEAGAFPTSYIPTVASTVTRSADNASMSGTNFSSWYNPSEGTILTNTKYDGAPISGVMNRIAFYLRGTGSANTWHGWWEAVNTGGTLNYNGTSFDATLIQSGTTISQGSRVKLISAIKTNDFAFSQNGGTVQTDTSVILPITHTIIDIGSSGGGNYINGTIAQLLYYPKRLSNAQLQALTR